MKPTLSAIWVFSFLFLVSCSLNPQSDHARLLVKVLPAAGSLTARDFPSIMSPPTQVSGANGFSCLGINVMGPGIGDSGGGQGDHHDSPESLLPALYSKSSYCSYPGVTSAPFPTTGTGNISLSIPTGPRRIVQVVGVQSGASNLCSGNTPIGSGGDNGGSGPEGNYFEVGRAELDIFSDQVLSIPNEYNSASALNKAKRQLNCGGYTLSLASAGPFSSISGNCSWAANPGDPTGLTPTTAVGAGYETDDSVLSDYECFYNGTNVAWQVFPFDVTGINLSGFSNIRVSWKGKGGHYGGGSCTSSSPSAGNPQIVIYNFGSPGYNTLATGSDFSLQFLSGSTPVATPISNYVSGNTIYVAVLGSNVISSCSVVRTDFISLKLQK